MAVNKIVFVKHVFKFVDEHIKLNIYIMRKSYLLIALGAVFFSQTQNLNAQGNQTVVEFYERYGMPMPVAISDNGNYVVGVDGMGIDTYIWNTDSYQCSLYQGESEKMTVTFWDVADDGTAVGENKNVPATCKNGVWVDLETPGNWNYAVVKSVTPDGKRMAGWGMKSYKSPCAWIDGKAFQLKMPEKDMEGLKPQSVSAEIISPDGTMIFGFSRINRGYYGTGLVWRNFGDDPSSVEPEEILADRIENDEIADYCILAISGDGKWIAGQCGAVTPNPDIPGQFIAIPRPYRYNLETGVFQIIQDVEVESGFGDGGVTAIDNNGTVFSYDLPQAAGNPYTRLSHVSVVGESSYTLADYVKNVYNNTQLIDELYFPGCVSSISADGKKMIGWGCQVDKDGGFVYREYLIRTDGSTAISNVETGDMKCFVDGKTLQLEGVSHVEVIGTDGSVLFASSVNAGNLSLDQLSAGIYAVKLTDGKNVKIQKIILGR